MGGERHIRYLLISILLALFIFSGCKATIGGRAFRYEEPLIDSDITVTKYVPDKACNGTTLLADNHRRERPTIIEIDMQGRVIWEYAIPPSLGEYTNPGFDVELLPNNNVLFVREQPNTNMHHMEQAINALHARSAFVLSSHQRLKKSLSYLRLMIKLKYQKNLRKQKLAQSFLYGLRQ